MAKLEANNQKILLIMGRPKKEPEIKEKQVKLTKLDERQRLLRWELERLKTIYGIANFKLITELMNAGD
jgi:hypothetical protein